LQHQGAGLRRQPAAQVEAAPLVVEVGELPQGMLPHAFRLVLQPATAAILLHELLDVRRGAVARDLQQVALVLRRADARDRPDLGVADGALAVRRADLRQLRERIRDPHLLARRVHADAALVVEPVGTGVRPVQPPELVAVELADHLQHAVLARAEPGGVLRDALAEARAGGVAGAELGVGWGRGGVGHERLPIGACECIQYTRYLADEQEFYCQNAWVLGRFSAGFGWLPVTCFRQAASSRGQGLDAGAAAGNRLKAGGPCPIS